MIPSFEKNLRILIVENDRALQRDFQLMLMPNNQLWQAYSLQEAKPLIAQHSFDLVLLDLKLPDGLGFSLLPELFSSQKHGPIFFLSGDDNPASAALALEKGAAGYLLKTLDPANQLLEQLPTLFQSAKPRHNPTSPSFRYEILGGSLRIRELKSTLAKISQFSNGHVLILGPSGSGKELIARRLNALKGGNRPFVIVDCATLSEAQFESHFFGQSGSSGLAADSNPAQIGCIERAHHGDLFLDGIGNLSLALQAKLLRFLEDGKFSPVGSQEVRHSDFRTLASSNLSLKNLLDRSFFRIDLYHRFMVTVEAPALEQHKEDIPTLARYFLHTTKGHEYNFGPQVSEFLMRQCYRSGNVRALHNSLEGALIAAQARHSQQLTEEDFQSLGVKSNPFAQEDPLPIVGGQQPSPAWVATPPQDPHPELVSVSQLPASLSEVNPESYKQFNHQREHDFLHRAFRLCDENATRLGKALAWSYPTTLKKLKDAGISKKENPKDRNTH